MTLKFSAVRKVKLVSIMVEVDYISRSGKARTMQKNLTAYQPTEAAARKEAEERKEKFLQHHLRFLKKCECHSFSDPRWGEPEVFDSEVMGAGF